MSDPRYYIRHADGDITLDGCLSTYPEADPGETIELSFIIGPRPYVGAETAAGGTAGGPAGFTAGGPAGATASQQVPIQQPGTAYRRLIAFADYAGAGVYGGAEYGVPFFREKLPDDAPKTTNLVRIEPGDGVDSAPELWALVTGIDDATTRTNTYRVSVELFVLGDTTAYADASAVRTALEETV